MIEKGIEESENISKEIINSGYTNVKEEIIGILLNRIISLEKKIKSIHNSIKK